MNTLRAVSTSWLAEKLSQQVNSVVILDLRNKEDFVCGHVRSSVNLRCPDLDTQQRMERGVNCLEQLLLASSSQEDRDRLASRGRSGNDVVLYDEESTEGQPDEALVAVADMLAAEKCQHVCFVNGGFSNILKNQKEIILQPVKRNKGMSRPRIAPLCIPKSTDQVSIIPKLTSGLIPSTRGHISEVLPGIFLGDEVNAEDRSCMTKYGITDVFNVTSDLPNVFEADKALNLNYIRFAVSDDMTSDLQLYFQKSHDLIDQVLERKGRVLVHCLAGISRSPTLVLAYIMRSKKWSFDTTFEFVRFRKSNVNPNFGFCQQLRSLEEELLKDQRLCHLDAEGIRRMSDKLFEVSKDEPSKDGTAEVDSQLTDQDS